MDGAGDFPVIGCGVSDIEASAGGTTADGSEGVSVLVGCVGAGSVVGVTVGVTVGTGAGVTGGTAERIAK